MNKSDLDRNACLLTGSQMKKGYMCWWHSFQGQDPVSKVTRTFFIEYRILNPGYTDDKVIYAHHPYYKKKGMAPSYVLIKAGVFPCGELPGKQISNYYPIADLKVATLPFVLQAGDCTLREDHLSGFVSSGEEFASQNYHMTDSGMMEWDLECFKSMACHTGVFAGPFMNLLNAFDSFWHAEGLRSSFKGSVTLDGITYLVTPEESYGYADKHWGHKFNQPRLHLSTCKLKSKRTGKYLKYSAVVADGCCPRFLCFPLRPRLMLQLTYTGEDFCFPLWHPRPFSRILWKRKETNKRIIWHLKAKNKNALAKISMNCLKQDLMPLYYEDPAGRYPKTPIYAGGTGVGTIELFRLTASGKQWIDTLEVENVFCETQK